MSQMKHRHYSWWSS